METIKVSRFLYNITHIIFVIRILQTFDLTADQNNGNKQENYSYQVLNLNRSDKIPATTVSL